MRRRKSFSLEVDQAMDVNRFDGCLSGLEDADTTATMCGQVAGAFYGETGIPVKWLEGLFMCAETRFG